MLHKYDSDVRNPRVVNYGKWLCNHIIVAVKSYMVSQVSELDLTLSTYDRINRGPSTGEKVRNLATHCYQNVNRVAIKSLIETPADSKRKGIIQH